MLKNINVRQIVIGLTTVVVGMIIYDRLVAPMVDKAVD